MLTGAPGTGKTTLRRALVQRIADIEGFDYGELLLRRKTRQGIELRYEDMREQSASVISSADVVATDDMVVGEVSRLRSASHIIIDSHALTREAYGFRAVPFSLAHLRDLRLDAVVFLRCDPEALINRVEADPGGRRNLTVELAREIQLLQESLSLVYAVACACPFHAIDTTHLTVEEVLRLAVGILTKLGITPE